MFKYSSWCVSFITKLLCWFEEKSGLCHVGEHIQYWTRWLYNWQTMTLACHIHERNHLKKHIKWMGSWQNGPFVYYTLEPYNFFSSSYSMYKTCKDRNQSMRIWAWRCMNPWGNFNPGSTIYLTRTSCRTARRTLISIHKTVGSFTT